MTEHHRFVGTGRCKSGTKAQGACARARPTLKSTSQEMLVRNEWCWFRSGRQSGPALWALLPAGPWSWSTRRKATKPDALLGEVCRHAGVACSSDLCARHAIDLHAQLRGRCTTTHLCTALNASTRCALRHRRNMVCACPGTAFLSSALLHLDKGTGYTGQMRLIGGRG